jgi:hypothetical protein
LSYWPAAIGYSWPYRKREIHLGNGSNAGGNGWLKILRIQSNRRNQKEAENKYENWRKSKISEENING